MKFFMLLVASLLLLLLLLFGASSLPQPASACGGMLVAIKKNTVRSPSGAACDLVHISRGSCDANPGASVDQVCGDRGTSRSFGFFLTAFDRYAPNGKILYAYTGTGQYLWGMNPSLGEPQKLSSLPSGFTGNLTIGMAVGYPGELILVSQEPALWRFNASNNQLSKWATFPVGTKFSDNSIVALDQNVRTMYVADGSILSSIQLPANTDGDGLQQVTAQSVKLQGITAAMDLQVFYNTVGPSQQRGQVLLLASYNIYEADPKTGAVQHKLPFVDGSGFPRQNSPAAHQHTWFIADFDRIHTVDTQTNNITNSCKYNSVLDQGNFQFYF